MVGAISWTEIARIAAASADVTALLSLIPRAVFDDGAGDKRRRHELVEVVGDHRNLGELTGVEPGVDLITDLMPEMWTTR